MPIPFDDIENAFVFLSMDKQFMNNAYLNKETGEIYYTSEIGDSDELPEDIDDSKYVSIPHPNDLDLGEELVFEFISRYLPEESDLVGKIFSKSGAYSRFKDLLSKKGLLDKWYDFEDEQNKNALKQWCLENDIEIKD